MERDLLKELDTHQEETIGLAVQSMPATRRHTVLQTLSITVQRLLYSFNCLSRVNAAATEGAVCDEIALAMCELFNGSFCDVYQADALEGEMYLRINHRVYMPSKLHGLFGRMEASQFGKVVSVKDVAGTAEEGSLSVLEWYEARGGYKEYLVVAAEQETIAARLNERKLKVTKLGVDPDCALLMMTPWMMWADSL